MIESTESWVSLVVLTKMIGEEEVPIGLCQAFDPKTKEARRIRYHGPHFGEVVGFFVAGGTSLDVELIKYDGHYILDSASAEEKAAAAEHGIFVKKLVLEMKLMTEEEKLLWHKKMREHLSVPKHLWPQEILPLEEDT